MTMVSLVWLRKDLRIQDNPALQAALQTQKPVACVYIDDPHDPKPMGAAARWWTHYALTDLQESLKAYNIPLWILQDTPLTTLQRLITTHNVHNVFWNRLYTPYARTRDEHIKSSLKDVTVSSYNSSLLFEPWHILNQKGLPFQIFGAFWRHCCTLEPPQPLVTNLHKQHHAFAAENESVASLRFLPQNPNWADQMESAWDITEKAAHNHLENFLQERIHQYTVQRDYPDNPSGTSTLSPYLHHGQISPHRVWHTVSSYVRDYPEQTQNGYKFLSELGWREFAQHLLYHWPHLERDPFQKSFTDFPWMETHDHLSSWQKGLTGIPIVDAGMRQLWQTGWMHNRVRMIVGSFLTKHLLIHWKRGEEWFWDTLVDADLASNIVNWQWIAGCGVDAAPYFRIFNPVLQGQKFDPTGAYVKRFIPELAPCPMKYIHTPWLAPMTLPYPSPIVDLKEGRNRALGALVVDRFKL